MLTTTVSKETITALNNSDFGKYFRNYMLFYFLRFVIG